MNTNDVGTIIKVGDDVVNTLLGLRPELLVIVACIVIGWILKYIPIVRDSNWMIPCLLCFVVGPVVYYKVGFPSWEALWDFNWPAIRQLILGMCLGCIAWTAHRAWLKDSWVERKLFGVAQEKPIPDSASQ